MSKLVQNEAILKSLEPLFDRAEAEGLWFYHDSKEAPEVWASPRYLHLMHSKGRMIWAPEHWELRSPMAYMKKLHRDAQALIDEYNEMADRLNLPDILLLEKQNMDADANSPNTEKLIA